MQQMHATILTVGSCGHRACNDVYGDNQDSSVTLLLGEIRANKNGVWDSVELLTRYHKYGGKPTVKS